MISNMITERHNIACRTIFEAISKDTLGACFVSMDAGGADRLALQNLQIPDNATNRVIPKWLLPSRFPNKDRLTSSRPDAVIMTNKNFNNHGLKQDTGSHPPDPLFFTEVEVTHELWLKESLFP